MRIRLPSGGREGKSGDDAEEALSSLMSTCLFVRPSFVPSRSDRYPSNHSKSPRQGSAWLHQGAYLLRTNLTDRDPQKLWRQYIQLTDVEAVFRTLKSELNLRPVFHLIQRRVEAHILLAFLGYCLWICLTKKLRG
jgi:hypothetical protein